MIVYKHLKSKNPFLKVLFKLVNLVLSFIVGTINLFISIGNWFFKLLTKKYKYEYLYIVVISVICMFFAILGLTGVLADQELVFLGKTPFANYIILIVAFHFFAIGLTLNFLPSRVKKKINSSYFYVVRALSYAITTLLLLNLVDFFVLDFVSRYRNITRPNEDTSTYNTMIYFIKEYSINFKEGIKATITLALLGTCIGLLLAFLLVALRMLQSNPRDNDFIKLIKSIGCNIAKIYVTVIRGTPMVVQAFIFYFLVLAIVRPTMSRDEYLYFADYVWTPFRAGLFTVSVNTAAYLTEVLRGGLNAVDKGQKEAAEALGFGKVKTMMLVVFPQAIKHSLPSIGNEFIVNIKDTSVLTLIGVLDLFSVANMDILGKFQTKSLEAYLIVAIYYLILTFLTSKLLQYFEKKMNMPVKAITSSN